MAIFIANKYFEHHTWGPDNELPTLQIIRGVMRIEGYADFIPISQIGRKCLTNLIYAVRRQICSSDPMLNILLMK